MAMLVDATQRALLFRKCLTGSTSHLRVSSSNRRIVTGVIPVLNAHGDLVSRGRFIAAKRAFAKRPRVSADYPPP